jgi:hypothetical protein
MRCGLKIKPVERLLYVRQSFSEGGCRRSDDGFCNVGQCKKIDFVVAPLRLIGVRLYPDNITSTN